MIRVLFEIFPNLHFKTEFLQFLLILLGICTLAMIILAIFIFVSFRRKGD